MILDDFGDAVLFRNTWGDAVYAIIDEPATAARIALAMQERLNVLPPGLGLDGQKAGMRIGIHFGPIYRGVDPVVGNALWYGTEVTRTARIEPVTLVGQVYCTQPLAAMLALGNARDFDCDYVARSGSPRIMANWPSIACPPISLTARVAARTKKPSRPPAVGEHVGERADQHCIGRDCLGNSSACGIDRPYGVRIEEARQLILALGAFERTVDRSGTARLDPGAARASSSGLQRGHLRNWRGSIR